MALERRRLAFLQRQRTRAVSPPIDILKSVTASRVCGIFDVAVEGETADDRGVELGLPPGRWRAPPWR